MSSRLSPVSEVRTVLVVSLSNLGDIVLTCPVIDVLKAVYPESRITVITGPKAKGLFASSMAVSEHLTLDKQWSWGEKLHWVRLLRKKHFDLVVDLRNTILPFMLRASCATPFALRKDYLGHRREMYLHRLSSVLDFGEMKPEKRAIVVSAMAREEVSKLTGSAGGHIVLTPGAADDRKRWPEERFLQLAGELIRVYGRKIVLLGSEQDRQIAQVICTVSGDMIVNLCGRTSLSTAGAVLDSAFFAVTNDSGLMHLASYLDVPVVALFGPTDPALYGPWSKRSCFLRRGQLMGDIPVEDVLLSVKEVLS